MNPRNFAKIRYELPQKKVEFRKKNINFDFCISQVGVLSSTRIVAQWISVGFAGEHLRPCAGMSTPAGPRRSRFHDRSLPAQQGWSILHVNGHRCAIAMSASPRHDTHSILNEGSPPEKDSTGRSLSNERRRPEGPPWRPFRRCTPQRGGCASASVRDQ